MEHSQALLTHIAHSGKWASGRYSHLPNIAHQQVVNPQQELKLGLDDMSFSVTFHNTMFQMPSSPVLLRTTPLSIHATTIHDSSAHLLSIHESTYPPIHPFNSHPSTVPNTQPTTHPSSIYSLGTQSEHCRVVFPEYSPWPAVSISPGDCYKCRFLASCQSYRIRTPGDGAPQSVFQQALLVIRMHAKV